MSEHHPARARTDHPGGLWPDRRPDGAQGRAVAVLPHGQGASCPRSSSSSASADASGAMPSCRHTCAGSSPRGPRPPLPRMSSDSCRSSATSTASSMISAPTTTWPGLSAAIQEEWGVCSNKVFYLAVPPSDYELIFRQLSASGLTIECSDATGWTRVLVEKPFGDDLDTARELDTPSRQPVSRGADLPHRPLPRQGDAAGHPELPLHQQPLRERVEPAGDRGHRHHAARADRRREARRVLRPRRSAARCRPEPPAADARARHHGAASDSRRRRYPRRPRCAHRVADSDDSGRGCRQHVPCAGRRVPRDPGRLGGFADRELLPAAHAHDRPAVGGRRRDDGGRQVDGRGVQAHRRDLPPSRAVPVRRCRARGEQDRVHHGAQRPDRDLLLRQARRLRRRGRGAPLHVLPL